MGEDRVDRRAIIGAGAGLLASMAGCSGLFIEETATPTGGAPSATATSTPTATPTAERTGTRAGSPRPTPVPGVSEDVDVQNVELLVERSKLERFALVVYQFDIENTSDRPIRDVEFRVRARYDHEDYSRLVGTSYPRFWFDTDDDEDDDEEDRGLPVDETERVRGDVRFERDGRAENSTDAERFSLELTVRRVRFVESGE